MWNKPLDLDNTCTVLLTRHFTVYNCWKLQFVDVNQTTPQKFLKKDARIGKQYSCSLRRVQPTQLHQLSDAPRTGEDNNLTIDASASSKVRPFSAPRNLELNSNSLIRNKTSAPRTYNLWQVSEWLHDITINTNSGKFSSISRCEHIIVYYMNLNNVLTESKWNLEKPERD